MTEGDHITDANLVASLLRRVKEQRALLTVTVPEVPGSFNSAILELDPDSGRLVIDELKPKSGHERLLQAGRLVARARVRGVEIRFSAALEEAGNESGVAFYRLRWPDAIDYLQKRSSFRIKVSMTSPLTVLLEGDGGERFEGRAIDLSEQGIRVEMDSYLSMQPGRQMPCQLNLPNGSHAACRLEIRHVRTLEATGNIQFGARLVDLPPAQRRDVARLVADIQRALIRRLPKEAG